MNLSFFSPLAKKVIAKVIKHIAIKFFICVASIIIGNKEYRRSTEYRFVSTLCIAAIIAIKPMAYVTNLY